MNEHEAFKGQRHGGQGVLQSLHVAGVQPQRNLQAERRADAPERISRITCMRQSEGIPIKMSVTLASTA